MPTTTDLLTLQQWLSPAYPLGSFAYSHGLETEIAEGRVTDAAALRNWLEGVLRHGAGRSDAILIRVAASGAAAEADAMARVLVPSAERLKETLDQGAAFQRTTAAIWGGEADALTFPVAFGAALARLCMPVSLGVALYLQAFASNLVSAAVRLVPLGQTEGQEVLAALSPLCDRIAGETEGAGLDDIGSAAFLADIASMRHEALDVRVFRT
ncbi:urease accessory protein UreF [Pseudaestuariivita atlantica]|uniref:Urease accessory protein UreF n=1 Tax=Pseudaestuariivita atlantica TaxID=1317121 RepID=A0A0L1JT25_9RHOB|nr:urease accessory UreF family protein [Pseudaestuariivita atlantica]KNG94911.1 urease accessory protein UreF [Pseudaestuariivita atlantica]